MRQAIESKRARAPNADPKSNMVIHKLLDRRDAGEMTTDNVDTELAIFTFAVS